MAIEDDDSVERIAIPSNFSLKQEDDHPGCVSYKVVEFQPETDLDGVSADEADTPTPVRAFLTTQHMNGNSSSDSNETRLAVIAPGGSPAENAAVMTSGGQFFVIGETVNLFTSNQRPLAPLATMNESRNSSHSQVSTSRDEKRRVSHNEVERRRRDKINNWISKLAKVLPDCPETQNKNHQSKGCILAKAVDYITDLKHHQDQQTLHTKELLEKQWSIDSLQQEIEVLKSENSALKNENALLKAQLQRNHKSCLS